MNENTISQNGFTVAQLMPLWQKNALGQNTCPPGGGPWKLYDTFAATGQPGAPSFSAEQEYRNDAAEGWHQANPNATDAQCIAAVTAIYNAPPDFYTNAELAFLGRMFKSKPKA